MQQTGYQSGEDQASRGGDKTQGGGQQDQKKGMGGGIVSSIQENLPVDLSLIKITIGEATYPAKKEELIATAESKEAGEEVLNALKNLPEKVYQSVEDVTKAIEGRESR